LQGFSNGFYAKGSAKRVSVIPLKNKNQAENRRSMQGIIDYCGELNLKTPILLDNSKK
jgi:hypothetical protein